MEYNKDAVLVDENLETEITTITLNRPEVRNAINSDVFLGLQDAIDKIVSSKTRVIIITGGDEYFSSGVDLTQINTAFVKKDGQIDMASPSIFRYMNSTFSQHVFSKLEKLEKPIIAKINGYCFGMAMELILACDLRFCTDSAIFSLMEA